MKKFVPVLALLGALIWAGAATASDPIFVPAPISGEGCVSHPGDTCTYTSTRTGGLAANGSTWSLVVSLPAAAGDPRDVNADGKLTWTYGPSNAPPLGCGLYPAGSTVTTSAGSSAGIAAGNPFPAPSDGVRNNDCADGVLPNRAEQPQ